MKKNPDSSKFARSGHPPGFIHPWFPEQTLSLYPNPYFLGGNPLIVVVDVFVSVTVEPLDV
jgi:hypothetical protein